LKGIKGYVTGEKMKQLIKRLLRTMGYHIVSINKNINVGSSVDKFSNLGEEDVIQKYLSSLSLSNKICIDIAASDGIHMSNTFFLFEEGWEGVAVECDSEKFALLSNIYVKYPNVSLIKNKVTPDNISNILKACLVPQNFTFLNFDIDSYDYFVLDQLLSEFRPLLMCVEVNEKIPPPIKFTIKYNSDYLFHGGHFYGQSIAQLYELCKKYDYELVELFYNNAFLIPKEINKWKSLQPEEAYDIGYKNKKDRKDKFPWNKDMEELLHLSPAEGILFLKNKFSKYNDQYSCSL
jgi:hypothetical protein